MGGWSKGECECWQNSQPPNFAWAPAEATPRRRSPASRGLQHLVVLWWRDPGRPGPDLLPLSLAPGSHEHAHLQ